MKLRLAEKVLALKTGDITQESVDAVVNAANSRLSGGGGVDGAIHRAGGPSIMEECRRIGHCPTGSAVLTGAGNLKAKYVIHAVGPIWRGGNADEETLLRQAYRSSLELADSHGIESISFPSISTGAYGYPVKEAARAALSEVMDFLSRHPTSTIKEVNFVLFDHKTFEAYAEALRTIAEERSLSTHLEE